MEEEKNNKIDFEEPLTQNNIDALPDAPMPPTPNEPPRIIPPMIEIEWEDVMSYESALLEKQDLLDIEPATAYLIGYLVDETDEYYYVAKEWWTSEQFKYLHVVPKRSVIKVRKLKHNGDWH